MTIFGLSVIDDDMVAFDERIDLGGVRGTLRLRCCSSSKSTSSPSAVVVVACDLDRLDGEDFDAAEADDAASAAADDDDDFLLRRLLAELTDMIIDCY